MKKIFYSILAAAAILTGCNHELIVQNGTGKGALHLDLDCKSEYTEIITKAKTDAEIIDGLIINIVRADGYSVNKTGKELREGNGIVELPSGSYTLTASSPEKKDYAFDQPVYEASKSFEIKIGETTNLGTLVCTIKNVKVSVELSENFMRELTSFDVTVSNGKGNLLWTRDSAYDELTKEGKKVFVGKQAGYFSVAPLTVNVSGYRKSDGSIATKSYKIAAVNAADHHLIKLDAKVTGNLDLDIQINDKTNDQDQTVVVPGFDDEPVDGNDPGNGGDDPGNGGDENPDEDIPGTSTAPTLTWALNPNFMDVHLTSAGVMSLADGSALNSVELLIKAPAGIKNFYIDVNSAVLAPFIAIMAGGLEVNNNTVVMDLIHNDTLYASLHADLPGLPMKDQLENKTEVPLSMTDLVPMINIPGPSVGDVHVFNIRIEDNNGELFEKSLRIVSK